MRPWRFSFLRTVLWCSSSGPDAFCSRNSQFIVFGGIHRIVNVSAVLVPLMFIRYFVLAFVIIVMNFVSDECFFCFYA
ncbi:MAG: alanine:cation symporter family protein [Prevotella sp.]|nr:alanine:cation symporter family protein [Prevotella sp.]